MLDPPPVQAVSECWQDDKRMNSLFMPFRKKELNPVDWNSKMKFWNNAIENWCSERNDCVISVRKLEKEFIRKQKRPLCLTSVLEQLLRNGELKTKEELATIGTEQSWTTWAVSSFVKAPVVWSLTKLKDAIVETDISDTVYVYLPYLKIKGEEVLYVGRCSPKRLLTVEDLEELMKSKGDCIGRPTLEMLIDWLRTQRKISTCTVEGHVLIKFGKETAEPVTEADRAVFSLEKSRDALLKNLEDLESEKANTVEEARAYLRKGMKHSAKSSLRKKKELEKCITKRASALDNTEVLLSRIREADSDVKLLEAYKMGLSALKATFKNAGLTEDSVINTMDEVHEAIDIHEEIQSSLSQSVGPVLDHELEEELEALLAQPAKEPPLPDLPNVPEDEVCKIVEKVKDMKLVPAE